MRRSARSDVKAHRRRVFCRLERVLAEELEPLLDVLLRAGRTILEVRLEQGDDLDAIRVDDPADLLERCRRKRELEELAACVEFDLAARPQNPHARAAGLKKRDPGLLD